MTGTEGKNDRALSKKEKRNTRSMSGRRSPRSIRSPVRARQGHLLLDAGGQALHRLQQPVECASTSATATSACDSRGIHRVRRQVLAYANPSWPLEARPPPGPRPKLAEITPGDIDVFLLHQRGRPRPTRTRFQAGRGGDRPPTRSWRRYPLLPRRDRRQHDA